MNVKIKYFVYFEDGFCSDGDHGIAHFETREEAIQFIEERLGDENKRQKLACYQMIEGSLLELGVKNVITKITATKRKHE